MKNRIANKFKAVRTSSGEHTFASSLEARRYTQLILLQQAGEIDSLEVQPEFILAHRAQDPFTKQRIPEIRYIGDFAYLDCRTGRRIVEEVKGFETAAFKLKWKLVRPMYPDVEFRMLKKGDI